METKGKSAKVNSPMVLAICLPLLIVGALLSPALGSALLLTLFLVIVWGVAKFFGVAGKFKYGESLMLCVLTLSWILCAFFWARWTTDYAIARHTMEQSLRQCGEMLQNGKKKELQALLETLLASPVMKENGNRIAAEFRRTLDGNSGASINGVAEVAIIRNALLIWSTVILIWGILFVCRLRRIRQIFMIGCGVAAILVWVVFGVGRAVNGGYFSTHLRFDLTRLSQELRQDDPRPELLSILRHPRMQGYSYLRKLPPLQKPFPSSEAMKK